MSKRRLGNIFKRKLSLNLKKMFFGERLGPASPRRSRGEDLREERGVKEEWIKSQFRDFSKLGGELVVMKMGS